MTKIRRALKQANTLRGRLIIVLLVALVLSSALNNFIFSKERQQALRLSLANVAISRTVSLFRSLETAEFSHWTDILKAADTPFFHPTMEEQSLVEPRHIEHGSLQQAFADILGRAESEAPFTYSGGPATDRHYWEKLGAGAQARAAWSASVQLPNQSARPPRLQHFLLSAELKNGSWLNVMATFVPPPRPRFSPTFFATVLMSVGIILAVMLILTRMTRSLGHLEEAADRFSRGAEVTQLNEDGPVEIRNVFRAFNTMQERLTSFLMDRTRMLASISHDLRTPITAMRLRVELLDDDETKSKISSHLDDLQSMTEAALSFSKQGSSSEPLRKLDATSLVESIVDDFEQMDRPVSMKPTDRIVYECRPTDIKRMIQNLISNALAYGQVARIGLQITSHAASGEYLEITIDDDGPGIPADQIETMFQPFTRLETSRNRETGGSGLGLSIARSIARAHGGDLILSNRAPNGLRATITLPITTR